MTNKLKKLSIVLVFAMVISAVQIVIPAVVSAATGVNLVVNGDFEKYVAYKAANWTVSADELAYGNDLGRTGKALDITATGSAGIQTVTQTIYGLNGNRLPDGVYTLEAYVKGGTDISCLNSVTLGVTNTGITNVSSSAMEASSISSTNYTNLKLENVKVNNGSCNIVITIDMDSGDWKKTLSLDDVSFYKTGEINYVENGSFEGADGSGSTTSWSISTTPTTLVNNKVDGWGASTSSKHDLNLGNDTAAFTSTITQTTSVPAGVYTLEAWVAGGSFNSVNLFAGSSSIPVSASGSYTQVILPNIKVTSGGSIDIGLSIDIAATGWICLDDVSLYKTRGLNSVQNADFETGWGDGWTTSAPGITSNVKQEWDHTSGTGKKVNISAWGFNGTHDVSVIQNVPDIQKGVYNLTVWVAGGGSTLNSLTLTVGDNSSSNFKDNIVDNGYTKLEFNDIEVNTTSAAIGLSAQLLGSTDAGGWINIDDFDFYKVREIGDVVPVITAIEPVTMNTEVNEDSLEAMLPAKVTATYDTGATAPVSVTWDAITSTSYSGKDKIGTSFQVEGKVANSDVKAKATITVTAKSTDLNNDSIVNVGDLAKASFYFGSTSSSSNWASAKAADINGDSVINVEDLKLIADKITG